MDQKIRQLVTTDPEFSALIFQAVNSVKGGNVIALPTDTIYGIAALAQSTSAVEQLYHIKCRHEEKPVAICVGEVEEVGKWGKVTVSEEILSDLLPGPVTLVFERTPQLNKKLNPGTNLVGIRIPDHSFVRQLAIMCGEPVALTSANLSAGRSPLAVKEFEALWPSLDLIVDGGILGDSEQCRLGSTVINLSVPGEFSIIRQGSAYERTVQILQDKYNLRDAST